MGEEWRLSIRQHEPEAAREILRYFVEHPEAADTLEGLARWRLIRLKKELTMEQFSAALEWLVAHGFLKRISKSFAGPIYLLEEDHLADIERFLAAKHKRDS